MKVKYHSTDMQVTDAMKLYFEKKLAKIEKYINPDFKDDIKVDVNFKIHKDKGQKIEINFTNFDSKFYKITKESKDMYNSIDKAIDILIRDLRKEKEKSQVTKK